MSIRGIDAQIMVTRTADFVRESSAELKRGELAQEYQHIRAAAMDEHSKNSTQATAESEQMDLHLNEDGSSAFAGNSSRDKKNGEETDDESTQLVPPGNSTIDIRV